MANILVVDDEPDIVRVIMHILESRGHEVTSAPDGPAALESVAQKHPDVIILDLNLPRMDGFEVCRRLKEDGSTKSIPVVMMTAAYVSVDDARKGSSVGADEFIVKPFVRDVLVRNVERLLESS